MLLIPAIDLKDGHCVRLKQGDMDRSTTFSEDPGAMAKSWLDKGARRLHLVDLNGAFAGKPKNEAAIKRILAEVGSEIDVQLGGGIRDLDTISLPGRGPALRHHRHRRREEPGLPAGRLHRLCRPHHRRA